jgi:hypothetical protein
MFSQPLNLSRNKTECMGFATLGCILFLLIFSIVSYVSIQCARPYFKYWLLKGKIEKVATYWVETVSREERADLPREESNVDDTTVINTVLHAAEEVSVAVDRRNITAERERGKVRIALHWEDEITLPYYTKDMEFKIEVTKEALPE